MKGGRKLFTLALVFALPIGGFFLSSFLRPHTTAYAGHCVQRSGGDLVNACDHKIEMAFCYRLGATGKSDDPCERQSLDPGEPFTNYPTGERLGEPYTMACKSPYPPAWRRSSSNAAQWRKGCRSE